MGAPFARVAGGPNGAGTVALSVALVVGTKVSKKGSPDVRVLVLWNGMCTTAFAIAEHERYQEELVQFSF